MTHNSEITPAPHLYSVAKIGSLKISKNDLVDQGILYCRY